MVSAEKNTILVLDDEKLNLRLLKAILDKEYIIILAESAKDALDILGTTKIDLILSDIMMPEMDGYEFLQNIISNSKYARIPVIMCTAKIDISDVKKAIDSGAIDYIKKPIEPVEVLSKISNSIKFTKTLEKYEKDADQYKSVKESMMQAKWVQSSILPDKETFLAHFPNAFVLHMPRDIVSGDFYWIGKNIRRQIKIGALFDCIGHGIPGALLTMFNYAILNYVVENNIDNTSAEILELVRKKIISETNKNKDTYPYIPTINGMDAAFNVFHLEENILNFAGARRPLILVRPGGGNLLVNKKELEPTLINDDFSIFEVKPSRIPLDNNQNNMPFEDNFIQLKNGDEVIFFSDGVVDQFGGPKGKKLTKLKFIEKILDNAKHEVYTQKTNFYKFICEWMTGYEQTDDILIIGIKF